MNISHGKSLAPLTTFRIGGKARLFCVAESEDDIEEAVDFARKEKLPLFILGGGSNVLISDKGFDGLVVKMEVKGIRELGDSLIRAGAGENWDDFVAWTVKRGYGGLENLSLIPGTVGAAPVQNIGAYGVEVGDLVESVEVFDVLKNEFKTLSRAECAFSYRDSLFKREKGGHIIVSVLFRLRKNAEPDISYKDLKGYFKGKPKPSIREVRDAVIAIRAAKLPDIRKVGTAGSFFKNPIVSKAAFDELKKKYPELPSFPESDGWVKIPLAWIIDNVCGLKGKSWGKAGIHDTQALVIVNHGGASYADVEKVASEVEKSVKEKTGIRIEREVIVI